MIPKRDKTVAAFLVFLLAGMVFVPLISSKLFYAGVDPLNSCDVPTVLASMERFGDVEVEYRTTRYFREKPKSWYVSFRSNERATGFDLRVSEESLVLCDALIAANAKVMDVPMKPYR